MTEQFVADLREHATVYWKRHPFQQAMLAGDLCPEAIRAFVANRWYYQRWLPQKDAAILANCPEAAVRRQWLTRIVYHDDGGLDDWLRLCDAVGLDRPTVLGETTVLPGVRFAVDRYVQFARTAPWVAGVASSLTELFAPDLMGRRITAFRTHYPWIDPAGLGYFERRCVRAPREAAHALAVVLEHARTPDQRAECTAALTLKCEVLWAMLDALDHHFRVPR